MKPLKSILTSLPGRFLRKISRLLQRTSDIVHRQVLGVLFWIFPQKRYRIVVAASQEKLDNFYHFNLDVIYPLYTHLQQVSYRGKVPLEIISKRGTFTDLYSILFAVENFEGGSVLYQDQITTLESLTAGLTLRDLHFMLRRPRVPEFVRFCNFMRNRMQVPPLGTSSASVRGFTEKRILVIKRPASAPRCLLNHDQLMQRLRQIGSGLSDEISFENASLQEQAKAAASADILIAPHGAGTTNLLYMSPGATCIEIMPYYFRYDAYRFMAESIGVNYILVKSLPPSEDELSISADRYYPQGPERLKEILSTPAAKEALQAELYANISFKRFIRDVPMTVDAEKLLECLNQRLSHQVDPELPR